MNTSLPVKDTSRHPCFSKKASGSCGRAHLPVAPRCNIKCNYCDRKHDCVNESRPGVSSAVLTPQQAVAYMGKVLEQEPRITVAGIAGPGDPFANPAETLATMRLIKEQFPHLLLCMSSNGLNLPFYLDELAELDVTHVTVTMNAVDPAVGEKIYAFARDGKVVYRGREAAELLLSRQVQSVKGLKERGISVKVNTIVIPGVNEDHANEVARVLGHLDVDLHNLIPMYPNPGTPFGEIPEPSKELINQLRAECGVHVPQMTHCQRCRADAVGLLCADRSRELAPALKECSNIAMEAASKPYVAVATREGALINQHLGEARRFQIWGQSDSGFKLVEERRAPQTGTGPQRWSELATILCDCRAVLASAMGDTPRTLLGEHGLPAYECAGFIEEALEAVYEGRNLATLQGRSKNLKGCTKMCSGDGEGCG